eukprot:156363-Rhodomonas_salina.2
MHTAWTCSSPPSFPPPPPSPPSPPPSPTARTARSRKGTASACLLRPMRSCPIATRARWSDASRRSASARILLPSEKCLSETASADASLKCCWVSCLGLSAWAAAACLNASHACSSRPSL